MPLYINCQQENRARLNSAERMALAESDSSDLIQSATNINTMPAIWRDFIKQARLLEERGVVVRVDCTQASESDARSYTSSSSRYISSQFVKTTS